MRFLKERFATIVAQQSEQKRAAFGVPLKDNCTHMHVACCAAIAT